MALTRFIQDYYENVREGHNFESFYNHVTEHYPEILERKHIPKDYFSLESFSLNCGEFLPGDATRTCARIRGRTSRERSSSCSN